VFDYRTGDSIQIANLRTAMNIVALTAVARSPRPLSKNEIYLIIPKLSKGIPSQRSFLYQTLKALYVNGCLIDSNDVYMITLKGRELLERLLPVLPNFNLKVIDKTIYATEAK
jgi:hypothetical protein